LCYQPVDVINKLMQQGVNINAARYRNGETPLHIAAETGQLEVVNTLLAKNAYIRALRFEVNAAGYEVGITPLYLAAKNGHLEVVKAFLANPVSIHSACTDGKTPLHVAAEKGHLEVVNTLLAKNADINAAQDRDTITPLYLAAKNGHLDVVKVLLEQGANVNAIRMFSETPLYIAAKNGRLEVVKVLLEQRANINAANMFGKTPLAIAKNNNHPEIVQTINKQRLLDYINQTNARPDNHYKRTFTLFGRTIKYWGYSAKKKKEAANALKSVIFASADRSCLEVHKAALNNGELKSIYRDFGFR
jgi:ankyrin repeat protein